MSNSRKVHIKSYGCQMNAYDAQRMNDVLAHEGFGETNDAGGADLVILNTCHIREKASEKVFSELGRLRQAKEDAAREGRRMTIAVAGCVAQAEGAEIMRRAPIVDVVVGPQSYHRLPQLLDEAQRKGRALDTEFPIEDKFGFLPQPSRQSVRARGVTSFVTIQEGCDKFCTFCVVPYTRGAEVSRPMEKIVADVEHLAQGGVREITLIGQNVNGYHGENANGQPATLGDLLYRLAEIPGIARLRYMTSHPLDCEDTLIAAHRDLPALMPYLHLPVQSGSDRILDAMNRKHTRGDYLRIIEKFRKARPDMAFTSDFIVGFPGETDRDFEDTMDLVSEVGFAGAYSFKFSPRPGTPAADLHEAHGAVPVEVMNERLNRLQQLLDAQLARFNESCIGKALDILFEKPGRKEGQMMGRSAYLQPVHVQGPPSLAGRILPVKITERGTFSLNGVLTESLEAEKAASAANSVMPLPRESASMEAALRE